ncbi:hypothetical protein HPHPH19_0153 [Helicobacter pylori Hp H-19]|nr:hypothetical protein HPHPH19_0153 [Helicobacter pylori Hp H-19]
MPLFDAPNSASNPTKIILLLLFKSPTHIFYSKLKLTINY